MKDPCVILSGRTPTIGEYYLPTPSLDYTLCLFFPMHLTLLYDPNQTIVVDGVSRREEQDTPSDRILPSNSPTSTHFTSSLEPINWLWRGISGSTIDR